jgi:hypothetical protein
MQTLAEYADIINQSNIKPEYKEELAETLEDYAWISGEFYHGDSVICNCNACKKQKGEKL